MSEGKSSASFRDPSGFIFTRDGQLYRQVNQSYREEYDQLVQSGLYEKLVQEGSLVPHEESSAAPADPTLAYKILEPHPVPFISYPYEWSFSQLKDAARLTLKIQRQALKFDLSLKDASAYNIQFMDGRPILIDTLSFEPYQEGQPWVAYRQFCQHFLAPLALMACTDIRLSSLLKAHIDGIPLDLASRLLPWRTRLDFSLAAHIHVHAAAQKRYAGQEVRSSRYAGRMGREALLGMLDSLKGAVKKLEWKPAGTEWGDYYDATNYNDEALEDKKTIVAKMLERIAPTSVWDLGANTGLFSRVSSQRGIHTVAFDIDPAAVEHNYRTLAADKEKNLLPLILDLTNPSPAIGWNNRERMSLLERGPVDAVLALALVHHLAISNNVPLPDVAAFFVQIARWLVVEFIPKEDSQVQRLLASRKDIFPMYHEQGFEAAFSQFFTIHDSQAIQSSVRKMYLMERRP